VASNEHQIRTAALAFNKQEGYRDTYHEKDSAFLNGNGHTAFAPVLPLDQFGSGWSGESVNEASKQLNELRNAARDNASKQGIAALQAYAFFITGQDENAVELMHEVRFLEDVDIHSIKEGRYNEVYNIALIMMGYTVYGEYGVEGADVMRSVLLTKDRSRFSCSRNGK
jgi:hypothetical protein